jgi:hypothetical protein
MAPQGRHPSHPHFAQPSQATKAAMDVVESYVEYAPKEDKVKMNEIEEEVYLLR